MGGRSSGGTRNTTQQKSVSEEINSLPKAYENTGKAPVTKGQEEVFIHMRYEAGKILKQIEEGDSPELDYTKWLVNVNAGKSDEEKEIKMWRVNNLKGLQAQIDREVRNLEFDFKHGFIEKEKYERDLKRMYIVQHSLNDYIKKHEDIIY